MHNIVHVEHVVNHTSENFTLKTWTWQFKQENASVNTVDSFYVCLYIWQS